MQKRKKRMKVGYAVFDSSLPLNELNDTIFEIVKDYGLISRDEYVMLSGYPYGSCGIILRLYSMCDSNPLCIGKEYYCERVTKVKRKYARKFGANPENVYKINIYRKL